MILKFLKTMLKQKSYEFNSEGAIFKNYYFLEHINNLIEKVKYTNDTNSLKELLKCMNYFKDINSEELIVKIKPTNVENQKLNQYIDNILKFANKLYENGLNREDNLIVEKNRILANYYLYIYYNRVIANKCFEEMTEEDRKFYRKYEINRQQVEKDYLTTIKKQYNRKVARANAVEKISIMQNFLESLYRLEGSKLDYIRLLAIKESFQFGEFCDESMDTNIQKFRNLVAKCVNMYRKGELHDADTIASLHEIYSNGLYDALNRSVVKRNPKTAKQFRYNTKNKKCKKVKKEPKETNTKSRKSRRTYVCSDLHGQYNVYKKIIDNLSPNDKLYIIGDVIDRGEDGIKILQDLANRRKDGQVELLIGNHELMMIYSIIYENEEIKKNWISKTNGGNTTLNAFNNLSANEQKEILKLLCNALVAKNITVNGNKYQLVHANRCKDFRRENIYLKDYLHSTEEESQKELHEMIGSRSFDVPEEDVCIIVGHNITDTGKIEQSGKYIKIDCGAADGDYGNVGVLCLDNMKCIHYSVGEINRSCNSDIDR